MTVSGTPEACKPPVRPAHSPADHETSIPRNQLVQALGLILERDVFRAMDPANAREYARTLLDSLAAEGLQVTRRAAA